MSRFTVSSSKISLPDVSMFPNTHFTSLPMNIFINYTRYLTSLFKDSVCQTTTNILVENFLEIDVMKLEVKLYKELGSVLKACNKAFMIIPVNLILPKQYNQERSGHANLILINNISKTIEFFEPHGIWFSGHSAEGPGLVFDIEKIIKNTVYGIFPEKRDFNFINLYDSCPLLSVQNNDSFCLAWCMLLLEARLLNINRDRGEIIKEISQDHYANYLLKYISRAESIVFTRIDQIDTVANFTRHCINLKIENIVPFTSLDRRLEFLCKSYRNLQEYTPTSKEEKLLLRNQISELFSEIIEYRDYKNFHHLFYKYVTGIL